MEVSAVPLRHPAGLVHLSEWLGVNEGEASKLVDRGKLGIRLICSRFQRHQSNTVNNMAFLFAFTGCHLLSGKNGLFLMQVASVLQQCLAEASIVPLVLGQLLDSLDNFGDEDVQLSCPQLFAIWAIEHLDMFRVNFPHLDNQIDDILRRNKPINDDVVCRHMFRVATAENIRWKIASWNARPRFWANNCSMCRVSMQTFNGMTFYIPAVTVRQYGFKQDRPVIEEPFPVCVHGINCKLARKADARLRTLFSEPVRSPFPLYLNPLDHRRNCTDDYIDWMRLKKSFIVDCSDDSEKEEVVEDDDDDEDMD